MITKILAVRTLPPGTSSGLNQADVLLLLRSVRDVITSQPVLLDLAPPVTVVGDIHGQFHDLVRIFDAGGPLPDVTYLFLGNYVDRGRNSIECVCLLFAYKVKYPNNIFLLRGNHEVAAVCSLYGFRAEVMKYFNAGGYHQLTETFNFLPMAAIVAGQVFCIHGGISPHLRTVDVLRNMERPRNIDDEGVFSDVLWADPNPTPGADQFERNERGTSVLFSAEAVEDFLKVNKLAFIARAHQAVKGGFEWAFGDSLRSVVTVFSCPDYMQFGNKAAIMRLDTDANPTFITLDPEARREERPTCGPVPELKKVWYQAIRR